MRKEDKTRFVDLQLGKLSSWITGRQHAVRHADSSDKVPDRHACGR
jgi:hypothetical protein